MVSPSVFSLARFAGEGKLDEERSPVPMIVFYYGKESWHRRG